MTEYVFLSIKLSNILVKTLECSPLRGKAPPIVWDTLWYLHIHIPYGFFFNAQDPLYVLAHYSLFLLLLCCGGLTHV